MGIWSVKQCQGSTLAQTPKKCMLARLSRPASQLGVPRPQLPPIVTGHRHYLNRCTTAS
jgi:hypothetical protein